LKCAGLHLILFEELEGLIGFSLQILDKHLPESDALVQPRAFRVSFALRFVERL
jgi:hypothetical protein